MRDMEARLWAPSAAIVTVAAVRLVCSWMSAASHTWWTMAGDTLLLVAVGLLSAYYVAIILRRTREAGIAADRASRLEMVTRELVDHEAMIRDDLVRGQRELNERIVRLSGILDASRDLVATRDFREVLERITDMARSVVGADCAVEFVPHAVSERSAPVAKTAAAATPTPRFIFVVTSTSLSFDEFWV